LRVREDNAVCSTDGGMQLGTVDQNTRKGTCNIATLSKTNPSSICWHGKNTRKIVGKVHLSSRIKSRERKGVSNCQKFSQYKISRNSHGCNTNEITTLKLQTSMPCPFGFLNIRPTGCVQEPLGFIFFNFALQCHLWRVVELRFFKFQLWLSIMSMLKHGYIMWCDLEHKGASTLVVLVL
jgi:hypothetical protein